MYILKSGKNGKCYIGSTNDLRKRLKLHNDGKVPSTKVRRSLALAYHEAFYSEVDVRQREQKLKNYGKATSELYKKISNSLNVVYGAGYRKI